MPRRAVRRHPRGQGRRQEDDAHVGAAANLDTHAADVLQALETAGDGAVTLVGDSYGGMVISAAADRVPVDLVARLVHPDAYVPRDGESCRSLTTEAYRRAFVSGAADSGDAVRPPFRPPDGGDDRWRTHDLTTAHYAMREAPQAVADLLLGAAE